MRSDRLKAEVDAREEELKFIQGAKAAEKEAAAQRKYVVCREMLIAPHLLAHRLWPVWQDLCRWCALVTLRHSDLDSELREGVHKGDGSEASKRWGQETHYQTGIGRYRQAGQCCSWRRPRRSESAQQTVSRRGNQM